MSGTVSWCGWKGTASVRLSFPRPPRQDLRRIWRIGGLIVVVGLAALYGLHRLGLWLEKRGWLFYKHTKPFSSAVSCLVALQQVVEPPIQHVFHVKEEKRHQAEEEAPGQGDKPRISDDSPATPGGIV
jgi:hypothetical protein